jgi:hypothetical protein
MWWLVWGSLAFVGFGVGVGVWYVSSGKNIKPKRPPRQVKSEVLFTPIILQHAHPDGWGSRAVANTMVHQPTRDTCVKIAESLHTRGFAVVHNFFEDLCVEKIGFDVQSILRDHKKDIGRWPFDCWVILILLMILFLKSFLLTKCMILSL